MECIRCSMFPVAVLLALAGCSAEAADDGGDEGSSLTQSLEVGMPHPQAGAMPTEGGRPGAGHGHHSGVPRAHHDCHAGGRLIEGESAALGTGTVTTWGKLNARGGIVSVGVTMSSPALEHMDADMTLSVAFPRRVARRTVIDHLGLGFLATGHGPEPYLVPHYDVHFYGVPEDVVDSIDCVDEPMPSATALPSPYFIPGLGMEPDGTCVPQMGVHALDPTSPELSGSPFTETLILGYHAGSVIFIEPMITQATFASHTSYTRSIPKPESVGRRTQWPTVLTVTYDDEADTHSIVLSDFVATN